MRKLAEKIHYQFVSGQINGAIYGYMQKIATNAFDEDITIFDKHIKNMTALNVNTENDCKDYFYIYTHAPRFFEKLYPITAEISEKLCKFAFINRSQYNFSLSHNFTKLALDFLTKHSHPNNMGIDTDLAIRAPYNLDKWIETMRYIYDTANTNNLPLDSITKQVTAKWEDDEKDHFQRWMRYYQEGNYNKYNVKTAQFFQSKQDEAKVPSLKPVTDLFDSSIFPKPDPQAEKQQKINDVRKKLLGRFKSVIELLDKYRGVLPEKISDDLLSKMHDLQKTVWKLSLAASMVDSIIRTSNQFNKYGFIEGATELKKIAQEVAADKLPAPEGPVEIPAPNAEIAAEPEAPAQKPEPEEKDIRSPEINIGDVDIGIPDFNSATHRDALQKLEEINKVLSERNIVRALAAVDIILGQLGIASYFPKLSEAQSKLLDAFNYAGTRVAETIGQMRGGSGGPAAQKPKEDTVEVAEEVEKPVGEVVNGEPPAPAPVK